MEREKIIELLRSGNFTIIYWDSNVPELYEGKWNKEEEFKKDDYKKMSESLIAFEDYTSGYTPGIVILLTEALGGNSDSI